jgi:CHAT domain/Tetratricopeptide Repeats-Sensor
MVLDRGVFLTPSLLAQMRFAPRIVFINCCHLGEMRGDVAKKRLHRLAANVATEFIKMGSRVVIAAGWAVDDAAARDFAVTFYGEMLAGMPFGDAVRLARAEVYGNHSATNTWGAYQCYGDAAFTLKPGRAAVRTLRMVSARELAIAAANVRAQAGTATSEQRKEHLARLDDWLSRTPPEWLEDAGVCAAVGTAYGELREFEKAISHLGRLSRLELGEGLAPIEQLANFKARWAETLVSVEAAGGKARRGQRPGALPVRATKLFEDAEKLLDALVSIGDTSERYSLLGSLHKLRARAAKASARESALDAMAKAYATAYDLARKAQRRDAYYSLLNQLAAGVALSWRGRVRKRAQADRMAKEISSGLAELERLADALDASSTSFWELALHGDRRLLGALWRRKLGPKDIDDIEAAYRQAALRCGSPREVDSVTGQLEFFSEMAATELPSGERKAVIDALEALEAALKR